MAPERHPIPNCKQTSFLTKTSWDSGPSKSTRKVTARYQLPEETHSTLEKVHQLYTKKTEQLEWVLSRAHIKTAAFLFLLFIYRPFTLRQMQWLTIEMRFLLLRKCLCTIVSDSFHNWVHLLFPPPLSRRVKRFWNTVRERNAILHRCLVSRRALIFKLLYAAAFISPGKWQSVDALGAWLGFFFP